MLSVAAAERSDIGTVLLTRLAGFTAFLHENGYGVSAADSVAVLDVASRTSVLNQPVLREATLSALIKTREDRTGFTPDVVERIAATC